MLLACLGGILFSLNAIAVSSSKMSGADVTRGYNYDAAETMDEVPPTKELADEEDLEEDAVKVARRAVRKYPEESESLLSDRQQEQMPITRLSCDCPEVLTKGTLAAIVAALAFLGFFSTSVLLVVSIWVLRLMSKQKKTEPRDSKRHQPPTPPPRPIDRMYSQRKRSVHPYESLQPIHSNPAEGVYISASEINPGPRRNLSYVSPSRMTSGAKSSPENEYVAPGSLRTPPEEIYSSIQRSSAVKISSSTAPPAFHSGSSAFHAGSSAFQAGSSAFHAGSSAFHTGSSAFNPGSPGYPSGSPGYHSGSPGYHGSSPGFHGGSPTLPSGSPVGSPGSPVGSPKGRNRGTDEHIYEEVN